MGVYGLNFASWYLGYDVESIDARASVFGGVDSHTAVLMKYKNEAIADISSAILLRKPNEGYVYGSLGFARLPRFYAPQEIELSFNDGRRETISVPYKGNGFEEQIAHFCQCINEGLTESPLIPHSQTLYITKQMDEIRRLISITYPQDSVDGE